jgi:hypothetical protein
VNHDPPYRQAQQQGVAGKNEKINPNEDTLFFAKYPPKTGNS